MLYPVYIPIQACTHTHTVKETKSYVFFRKLHNSLKAFSFDTLTMTAFRDAEYIIELKGKYESVLHFKNKLYCSLVQDNRMKFERITKSYYFISIADANLFIAYM